MSGPTLPHDDAPGYVLVRRVRRGRGANPRWIVGHLVLGEYETLASALAAWRSYGDPDVLLFTAVETAEVVP